MMDSFLCLGANRTIDNWGRFYKRKSCRSATSPLTRNNGFHSILVLFSSICSLHADTLPLGSILVINTGKGGPQLIELEVGLLETGLNGKVEEVVKNDLVCGRTGVERSLLAERGEQEANGRTTVVCGYGFGSRRKRQVVYGWTGH